MKDTLITVERLREKLDKKEPVFIIDVRPSDQRHEWRTHEQCSLDDRLLKKLHTLIQDRSLSLQTGRSWTTDAPYRETASSIMQAVDLGADCVEMEASALYAFGKARSRAVVCYAHLTNSMAQQNIDFEKGAENGSLTSLELIYRTVKQFNYG